MNQTEKVMNSDVFLCNIFLTPKNPKHKFQSRENGNGITLIYLSIYIYIY